MISSSLNDWVYSIVGNFTFTEIKSLFIVSYSNKSLTAAARGVAFAVALSGGNAVLAESDINSALSEAKFFGAEGIFSLSNDDSCVRIDCSLCSDSDGRLEPLIIPENNFDVGLITQLHT